MPDITDRTERRQAPAREPLKSRIHAFSASNRDLAGDALLTNKRRLPFVTAISFVVHGILALYFYFAVDAQTVNELAWRSGIQLAHTVQSIVLALLCLVSHSRIYQSLSPRTHRLLQAFVVIDALAAGIVFVSIDQLVTSNITPFLLACTIMALAFYFRPAIATLLYLASYGAFLAGLHIHSASAAVLASNQVNGLAVAAIGAGLSILLWIGFSQRVHQQQEITKVNRELQETNEKLAFLATHDAMTGLLNRTRFEEHVLDEVNRIRRYGGAAALIIFDMDDFKRINDQYGHPVGDQAIRQIARTVRDNLRITDAVARWGGEEFSVLLPETTPELAYSVAEKIRSCIASQPFTTLDDTSVRLTASVGAAMLDISAGEPMVKAYHEADNALYCAKALGKDRVVFRQASPLEVRSDPLV